MSAQELLQDESNFESAEQEMPVENEGYESAENDENHEELLSDDNSDDSHVDSEIEHDDDGDEEELPTHIKKHFRRQERKLKKENRNLRQQLQHMQSTVESFARMQGESAAVPDGPQDEVIQKVNEVLQQRELQQQQMRAYQEQQAIDSAFVSALEEAEDRYPDFDEVVRNESLPLTQAMVDVAKFLPNGADVLYKLGKNPQEARRISQLKGPEMFKALVSHSYQLGSSAPKKVSSAPAPAGVKVKGTPNTSISPEQMSYEQLKAHLKRKRR